MASWGEGEGEEGDTEGEDEDGEEGGEVVVVTKLRISSLQMFRRLVIDN